MYGGTLENRCRILYEIIDGIRERCSSNFVLGVRLSPERFNMQLSEIKKLAQDLMMSGKIDFLDIQKYLFKILNNKRFQKLKKIQAKTVREIIKIDNKV